MSSSSSLTVAQQGFDAWRRGDFDALEAIFAPDVEWRWFEPGDWDCHSRDDVMRTLRQRHAAGFAEGRLNFHDAGSDVVVVTAHPSEAIRGRRKRQPSFDSTKERSSRCRTTAPRRKRSPPQNEAADHTYLQA